MTVMFPKYFGVHHAVIRNGLWARMKPSERNLYIYLMHESERRCTLKFKAKDNDVARNAGVAPRSICNARKKLQEYGLIRYATGAGNIYVYTACDPQTGCPYPGDPDKPKPYIKQGNGQAPPLAPVPATFRAEPPKPNLPPQAYGLPGVFDD